MASLLIFFRLSKRLCVFHDDNNSSFRENIVKNCLDRTQFYCILTIPENNNNPSPIRNSHWKGCIFQWISWHRIYARSIKNTYKSFVFSYLHRKTINQQCFYAPWSQVVARFRPIFLLSMFMSSFTFSVFILCLDFW